MCAPESECIFHSLMQVQSILRQNVVKMLTTWEQHQVVLDSDFSVMFTFCKLLNFSLFSIKVSSFTITC